MIGYLKGQLLDVSPGDWVVACGGVGYAVHVPRSFEYEGLALGAGVELFVHTHVREDALELFGFRSREERELFLLLLTVNGIGPKLAMTLLSGLSLESLTHAILNQDRDALTAISGVGKKTAERIFLDVADPLRKRLEARGANLQTGLVPRAGGAIAGALAPELRREVREALQGLGYREPQIQSALEDLGADTAAKWTTEDAIRRALRTLGART